MPSWKMVGGLPEIHQWIHYSLYWMHHGKTNHKHYPNLLLELMNVLAAGQAQNMQQKINGHLTASCISHAFNLTMLVYLSAVSPSTPSLWIQGYPNQHLGFAALWMPKIIFSFFLVKVACTFKNVFQYFLLLNFCLRSSQRSNRGSWIIVEIIQELVQNLKHTNVSTIFQNQKMVQNFSKPGSDHTFLCTPPSTYCARMTLIVTLPKSPDRNYKFYHFSCL